MKHLKNRLSYEQIVSLAQDAERPRVEFKNSTYLKLAHPQQDTTVKTKDSLKRKLTDVLSKVCSALANADGGYLIFGVNNDGSIDQNGIPAVWSNSSTKIDKFVEDLLRNSINPPLILPDVYLVYNPTDARSPQFLVIEVAKGHRAHQSNDRKYYLRRSKEKIDAMIDWEIEDIRNRHTHPHLKSTLDIRNSTIGVQNQMANYATATLQLRMNIENLGSSLANKWAVRVDCPFADSIQIHPKADYEKRNLPRGASKSAMVISNNPLFPTEAVELFLHFQIQIKYTFADFASGIDALIWQNTNMIDSEWSGYGKDKSEHWFRYDFTTFADSSERQSTSYQIFNTSFKDKLWEVINPSR